MRLVLALLALLGFATAAHAQSAGSINFGDNTSAYADNGECDDPRFEGEGMASILTPTDRLHDAVDCAAGVAGGKIALKPLPAYLGEGPPPTIYEIDFGDDTSSFARDANCDDSRFGGRMMANTLIESDIGHDAMDCLIGVASGELIFLGTPGASRAPVRSSPHAGLGGGGPDPSGIDFGDNTSPFANNAVCDDLRFTGEGVAGYLIDSDVLHDAADCRAAVRAGTATYRVGARISADGIDYGDDSSSFAFNAECDDPRFDGRGMAEILIEDDIRHDATDCAAGVEAGEIEYVGEP